MTQSEDVQNVSMLYVTCGSTEQARAIARRVVEEKIAACTNIIAGMKSVFHCEGRVEEGDEVVLILKTRASLVPAPMRPRPDRHART